MLKYKNKKLEVFDSPYTKGTYSKNVWDMQVFDNKIYIGQGNSANISPDANAGPIPINYFDPTINKFNSDNIIPEEKINQFKILDGKLIILGDDPKESWRVGNFYILEDKEWRKVRTIPGGIHNLDMEYNNGILFATVISGGGNKSLIKSTDFGETWSSALIKQRSYYSTVFNFKNDTYAISNSLPSTKPTRKDTYFQHVLKFNGVEFEIAVTGEQFLKGMPPEIYRIIKPTEVNNNLLYIVAEQHVFWEAEPLALYVAPEINESRKIELPEKSAIPRDIISRGDMAYVLTNFKISDDKYTNIVYESSDMINWTETIRFDYDAFARSFEELDGDFYFGLGCDREYLSPSTGNIIKISLQSSIVEQKSKRWSMLNNNESINIDLYKEYDIKNVVLNWEYAQGKTYKIQVSSDGTMSLIK